MWVFSWHLIWVSDCRERHLLKLPSSSHLDSPFDLERCGPAVDLALDQINKRFLSPHNIRLVKKKAR